MKNSLSRVGLRRLGVQFQFLSEGRSFKLFLINTEFSLTVYLKQTSKFEVDYLRKGSSLFFLRNKEVAVA